jgi:tRNA nucleotidyltransferase/poly(A) polymerase
MREVLRRALRRRVPLRRFLGEFSRAVAGAGGTAYLVGGYLRDIAEGKESGDVDLLVTGISYRRTGDVLRSLSVDVPGIRKVVAAGKHFPVHRVAVAWGKEYIDISNARPGGIPRSMRHGASPSIDDRAAIEDTSRRDFTINSLLFRVAPARFIENGRLLDPFGGIEDLRRKRIRCVGDPAERFREDPLRIVRAIRLKNERRGFVLHRETASAIRRLGPRLLPTVPPDRIAVELVRSLSADPPGTVEDLRRLGLMKVLLPESAQLSKPATERIATRYRFLRRSLGAPLPLPLLLCNLLADLRLDAAVAAARRLRLPDLRRVASTLRRLDLLIHPEALRFPLAETESVLTGAEDTRGLIAFYRAAQRTAGRPAKDLNRFLRKCAVSPFYINGILLKARGVPEGPERKEILLRVREETLAGKVTRGADAVRLAMSLWRAPGGGGQSACR